MSCIWSKMLTFLTGSLVKWEKIMDFENNFFIRKCTSHLVFRCTISSVLLPYHMHVVCWQIYFPQCLKVTKHFMPCTFTKDFSEEVGESLETQWAVWKAEFAAKWAENSSCCQYQAITFLSFWISRVMISHNCSKLLLQLSEVLKLSLNCKSKSVLVLNFARFFGRTCS